MTTALVWIALTVVLGLGVSAWLATRTSEGTSRVHATGQEIEVGLRSEVPLAIAVACFALGGALASLALATSGAPAVVSWLLALGFAAGLAGAVGTLLRRPRVLLTADRLDYRGWGVDASVAWDDIEGTVTDRRLGWRPLAEVLVRPDARSFRRRTALLALPEPMGRRPVIAMLARDLDEPWLLLEYVDQMARLSADERAGELGATGLAFLRDRR